jgi:hypothetical protein
MSRNEIREMEEQIEMPKDPRIHKEKAIATPFHAMNASFGCT